MEKQPSLDDLLTGHIYTVSEITERIKDTIEQEIGFEYVWVAGEVSNFRGNYSSGHWYFSLKDANSQLSAVCFKWANQGIKFLPEDGMEVICTGQIGVYEKSGIYQITVRSMEPKGVGADALALEQLKEKLLKEGLFDVARKRELPFLPRKIGIVTSPTGAALRDILQILGRRFPNLEILISPARVQGDQAAADIIRALEKLYAATEIDLIILARGGGSKEDLWCFNDEALARTIARSPVPVISAVGHEIDITVADLVADVRAPTPSAASEIAVREKRELVSELEDIRGRMALLLKNRLETYSREIDQIENDIVRTLKQTVDKMSSDLGSLAGKLDALSPLKVLHRGYSIAYKLPEMNVVSDSGQLTEGDTLRLSFSKGSATCSVDSKED